MAFVLVLVLVILVVLVLVIIVSFLDHIEIRILNGFQQFIYYFVVQIKLPDL